MPQRSSDPARRGPRPFQGRLWLAALLFLFLLALWSGLAESASVTVEQVPQPRAGSWTVDLTGTLPAGVQSEIDAIARAVREQGRGELAVVAIGSTGGVRHRDFATRLAIAWGIGSAERDDGVLIFAALDDRTVEIVLGLGLDSPAEVQVSQEIVHGEMIPRFRAGDPAGALRAGAEACARRLFHATLPAGLAGPPEAALPPVVASTDAPPGLLTAVEDLPPADTSLLSPAVMIGIPALLMLAAVAVAVGLPRRCPRCKTRMRRLGEAEDDAHLAPSGRLEEQLGSVDHQVWTCPGCGETTTRAWPSLFSSYSACPQCGVRAYTQSETVERKPTYVEDGFVRIVGACSHCDHRSSTTRTLFRLQRPDDDRWSTATLNSALGAASSAASSSSSCDSSGSSSSSSGSGFGGGSTGGAGAGGSW